MPVPPMLLPALRTGAVFVVGDAGADHQHVHAGVGDPRHLFLLDERPADLTGPPCRLFMPPPVCLLGGSHALTDCAQQQAPPTSLLSPNIPNIPHLMMLGMSDSLMIFCEGLGMAQLLWKETFWVVLSLTMPFWP